MESPLVSVIIPTYKRADFLQRAIESVLSQTYTNIEIIVVDDNDPDSEYRFHTEKKMEKFKHINSVSYIKHEKNCNGAMARNTGIRNSQGKYITYLDDDDIYYTTKIAKQVSFLENNRRYDAVYCGWFKDGVTVKPEWRGDLSYQILSGELVIRTNTIMMTREATEKIGGWNIKYRRNQEADLLLKFFKRGFLIGSIADVLVYYDSSDRSNESQGKENENDFIYFLKDHEDYINQISKEQSKSSNLIYAYRRVGVFLRYLKNREFGPTIHFYLKSFIKHPILFNYLLAKYVIYRSLGKDIFGKQR